MNNEFENLVRLNKSQVEPAAEALTKAFKEVIVRALPNDLNSEKVVHSFLSIGLHIGIKYGEVYATSSNYEGVVIWMLSDNLPITTWEMLSSVPLMAVLGFARHGGLKMRHFADFTEKMHKRLAPFKHWYLQAIGVDPKFRGKGYAGKLIRPMLAKIDIQHLPCYIETYEENVPIYERFGFKVIERAPVPQTSFENWAMLREGSK